MGDLGRALGEVGQAVRRPESLALRWKARGEDRPAVVVLPVLLAVAVLGVAAYGLVMRLHQGPAGMVEGAVRAPLAAGLAWTLALPALYIVGGATGSKLDLGTTVLAASITVCFGSLAMLAGVPITWLFGIALPYPTVRVVLSLVVFAGVGVAMVDVFLRVMRALEPERGRGFAMLWLGLVGVIGGELFILLDVFDL